MCRKLALRQVSKHSRSMLIRFLTGMSTLFLGMNLANSSFAHELESCPSGEARQIKERVIEPESFTDVLSDIYVVQSGRELLTIPAEWDWINKPVNYVRPEYIEFEEISVTSFGLISGEVEFTFQQKSHDILKKLDGTIERKIVPAIKKTRLFRREQHPSAYYVRKLKLPFDADTMETPTKIRVQTKPSLTIQRDVEHLPQYVIERFDITHKPIPSSVIKNLQPTVVGRIRHPATIKEYYGDCVKVDP